MTDFSACGTLLHRTECQQTRETHARLPADVVPGTRDVWPTTLRVVLHGGAVLNSTTTTWTHNGHRPTSESQTQVSGATS